MNQRNKKSKIFICILVLAMMMIGSACSDKAEYGEIQKVDINEDADHEGENVFTPVDEDLGYQYQKVLCPRAYMKMNVPAGWDVKMRNARHLEIQSPSEDPQIAGLTMHILFDFSLSNENRDTVGMYGKLFEQDLMGLYFNIDGKKYRQAGYASPSSQDTETSFTKRTDLISLSEIKDINLIHQSSGRSPQTTCTALQYYVRWADTPMVLSTICKDEDADRVKQLMTYMVSSITYEAAGISSVELVSYDGITFPVPNGFSKKTDNVYQADYSASSACSGMGIAVYNVDDKISAENIMFSYAKKMAAAFLPGNGMKYNNIYSCTGNSEPLSISGREVEVYTATASIMRNQYKPGDFYTTGQTWYLTVYAFPPNDNNSQKAIVIWSQDSQVKMLDTVRRLIEGRAEFD